MATKAEVRNKAASLLGRRTPGQAIESTLVTVLNDAYDHVYASLKDMRFTFWASADNTVIPDAVAPSVAALMALDATDEYTVSEKRMATILLKVNGSGKIKGAVETISRISTPIYESLDEPEDF